MHTNANMQHNLRMCWVSCATAEKHSKIFFCYHPLLAFAAGLTGPYSSDSLTLDQNRQTLAFSLCLPYAIGGWNLFFFSGYSKFDITLYFLFPLCCELKSQKRNIFFSSLCLFFRARFSREKRHMSYCCSGCGGLNMYNTSRHDHFLWLKPLKMAPYFLKPIDLPSKSVCICPEITCSLNPRTLQPS